MIQQNLEIPCNDNRIHAVAGNAALKFDGADAEALKTFVIALARHYARIDHLATEAANDNTH
ncbi:hypothetical protein [Bradyrhizobium liaoningense]|uniref:hypothetical protein n=1 Tax=Bradyrhizobium liaoningense TaxID=43992 RepID=UPI001BA895B6|nr:hypothetical protein [Bradyrhizobium liaoningense]MBR0906955.1 hypothetical protein [Bradyrhizobium liaoningense]